MKVGQGDVIHKGSSTGQEAGIFTSFDTLAYPGFAQFLATDFLLFGFGGRGRHDHRSGTILHEMSPPKCITSPCERMKIPVPCLPSQARFTWLKDGKRTGIAVIGTTFPGYRLC